MIFYDRVFIFLSVLSGTVHYHECLRHFFISIRTAKRLKNSFGAIYIDCLLHKILGNIKKLRERPKLNHSAFKRVNQLLCRHEPRRRPAVRTQLMFFTDIKIRIRIIKRACFAMTDFMGKMHPLLGFGFNFKRVNADIATSRACHRRNRMCFGQITAYDFRAAVCRNFIKLTCSRFSAPPSLQHILRN